MVESNHFWAGSVCRVLSPTPKYPEQVNSATDIITIQRDLGNNIPDKSWMLYLFEFFINRTRKKPISIELDLSCAFNDDGKFNAIFGGDNQHQFENISPVVGHSYVRQIIVEPVNRKVIYDLTDMNTGVQEKFQLRVEDIKDIKQILESFEIDDIKEINFEGSDHFTGVEWWNLMQDSPYPIRYQVMVSLLQYGIPNSADSSHIIYYPYNSLLPSQDQNSQRYPISFQNSRIMRGCICYNITEGTSNTGLEF